MTLPAVTRARWLLSSLLIVGAALFTVGVAAERNATDNHTEAGGVASPAGAGSGEATGHAEQAGGDEAGGGGEGDMSVAEQASAEPTGRTETSSKKLFGVNLESTPLVLIAALVSLVLAALTWRSDKRLLLLAAAAFAAIFAIFDVAEILHQINESRRGIAFLAAVVAIVHLVTVVAARLRASPLTGTTASS